MTTSEQLDALVIAAQSGKALVGYIIVVVIWGYIAYRTVRNKNLLDKLQKFPEKDRKSVWVKELGMPAIKGSLTPEQWLRSRLHNYYFLGFLALLVLVAVLFVVYLDKKNTSSADVSQEPEEPAVAVAPDPVYVLTPKDRNPNIVAPKVGWSKSAVLSAFGPPQFSGRTNKNKIYYQFKDYYLYVFFDNEAVAATSIISTNNKFKPDVGVLKCLGCFSFFDGDAKPFYMNAGTQYYTYVERTPTVSDADGRVARYYINSSAGAKFSKEEDCAMGYMDVNVLSNLVETSKAKDKKSIAWDDAIEFEKVRKRCKPNGIAWVDSFLENAIDFIWPEYGDFPN